MRISLAERMDGAPVPLLVARRHTGRPPVNPLEDCERILRQLESTYSPDTQGEVRFLESAIAKEYEI
jgi:hypothetical protein